MLTNPGRYCIYIYIYIYNILYIFYIYYILYVLYIICIIYYILYILYPSACGQQPPPRLGRASRTRGGVGWRWRGSVDGLMDCWVVSWLFALDRKPAKHRPKSSWKFIKKSSKSMEKSSKICMIIIRNPENKY